MVADLTPNIAAVLHGLESTGTKTKTTATTTTTTQQDEAADVSRFPVVSNEDIEELKSVAANKYTSRSTKQSMNVFNSWCSPRHLDIDIDYEPQHEKITRRQIEEIRSAALSHL